MIKLLPHQLPPATPDWTHFAIIGDRRVGKTFGGAYQAVVQATQGRAVWAMGPHMAVMRNAIKEVVDRRKLEAKLERVNDRFVFPGGGTISLGMLPRGVDPDLLWIDEVEYLPQVISSQLMFTGDWPPAGWPHTGEGVRLNQAPWSGEPF